MWTDIAIYSAIGCASMAVQDFSHTFYTRAVNVGKGLLAGSMDALGDLTAFLILSFSGVNLTTHYGWRGWIGVIPILVTALVVTMISTDLSHDLEDEDEAREDDTRDGRIQALEAKVQYLEDRLKEFR